MKISLGVCLFVLLSLLTTIVSSNDKVGLTPMDLLPTKELIPFNQYRIDSVKRVVVEFRKYQIA